MLIKGVAYGPLLFQPHAELLNGRFVIQRHIATGGMGVVYEAFDTVKEMPVALKTLYQVSPSSIYRLKQEFRSLAGIIHPNLIGLHDLFCEDGNWFFTMDYIDGKSLSTCFADRTNYSKMRQVFSELAIGIRAIHQAGMLHRDLKPSNILITKTGKVVILDFGLSCEQSPGGNGQTLSADTLQGTPNYMSPEQAAVASVSESSDWYSFGVMLFENLTGCLPFEGTDNAVLWEKQKRLAPPILSMGKNIPPDLAVLCDGLLNKNSARRLSFQHVKDTLPIENHSTCELPLMENDFSIQREQELKILDDALEQTNRGEPVVVCMHGDPGVGKSGFVKYALQRIQQRSDAVVLSGRCYKNEAIPLKTCDSLIDSLSHYLRGLPENQLAKILPRQTRALANLFPVLNRIEFVREYNERFPLPSDSNKVREIAHHSICELMANCAHQQPLVLYVDDLHWGDVDGSELLCSLAACPIAPPLLIIAVYRSDETESSPALKTFLKCLDKLPSHRVHDVKFEQIGKARSAGPELQLHSEGTIDSDRSIACKVARSPSLAGGTLCVTELARIAARSRTAKRKNALCMQ